MKKVLQVLFVTLFFLQANILSQSPAVQQIINSVKQDSIIHFVKELSGAVSTVINGTSQKILSRNKNQPGNALAETYIKQKLQSYGLNTTIQSFSTTGKNVIATQTGTEFPNKKYIVCAHFDDMPTGTIAPGADDNASGTAAVIEAARIFSQYTFPFTIVYALWDEEEQGLVGSEYYATQAANAGDSILGVINLDMIAWDSNSDGNADVHTSSIANTNSLKDKMLEVNLVYGINLALDVVPAQPYSDHQSFLDHGYSAILLIEDDNDFHQYYHTVKDSIQYFNQPYFTKMSKLALGTLASFALNLNIDITHTPIASVTTPQAINTSCFISTGLQIGSGALAPRLYYRTKQSGGSFGQFNAVVGTPTESGSYNFTIPATQLGTAVQYYIAAQDVNSSLVKTLPVGGGGYNPPGSTPPSSFYQFFAAELAVKLEDQANNITNWTSAGGWNITTAKYVSAPSSFTDSPGGNYVSNTTATLKYNNPINFTNVLGATLEFDAQWAIENDWDYGQVQISTNGGTTWVSLAGQYTNLGTGSFQPNGQPLYDGTQSTWVHEIIDISSYANQSINLRFLLRTDGSLNLDGWYVDNVKISVYTAATIQLTALIEGLFDGTSMVSDSVTVELHSSSAPYGLVDQRKMVLNSSGQGSGLTSTIIEASSYYLVVKHRNGLETWSASPLSFTNGGLTYDFTTAANKAYGNNMKLKGTKWTIFSGDVNHDGVIDISDVSLVDIDNLVFATGYIVTDVNGDNIVDLSDLLIVDINNLNFVSKIIPTFTARPIKIEVESLE